MYGVKCIVTGYLRVLHALVNASFWEAQIGHLMVLIMKNYDYS